MKDSDMLIFGIVFLVIALGFLLIVWLLFKKYKSINAILNREREMTGMIRGSIKEVVKVRRRNRSFRWTNEYPVVAYTVDGKEYTTAINYAEKNSGYYRIGGTCDIHYIPSEPECCVVEEFRKQLQKSRTSYLVGTVIVAFMTFNMLVAAITQILGAF